LRARERYRDETESLNIEVVLAVRSIVIESYRAQAAAAAR
jgi:hypothetical protein